MRKWVVTLPGHRHYTLESDTPAGDLTEMGYSAFELMELDGPTMMLWRKFPPVPVSRSGKSRHVRRQEGDRNTGKVIDLTARAVPVRWYIDINEAGETIRCRYVEAGEVSTRDCAHWRVVVEAATILQCQPGDIMEYVPDEQNQAGE